MSSFEAALGAIDEDLLSLPPADIVAEITRDDLHEDLGLFGQLNRFDGLLRNYCSMGLVPEEYTPKTTYGKSAVDLLQSPASLDIARLRRSSIGLCREAEPRLMQSIAYASGGTRTDETPAPLVIVTNTKNKPLGIVKQCGEPSFYTWGTVAIPNELGRSTILPGGSFSVVSFKPGARQHLKPGIDTVVASSDTLISVEFGRLDMTHYPSIVRKTITEGLFKYTSSNSRRADMLPFRSSAVSYKRREIATAVSKILHRTNAA